MAVADAGNSRLSLFRVQDGAFVRHLATGLSYPCDVEECESGWLVTCGISHTVDFVGCGGAERVVLGRQGRGDGEFDGPSALALVPSLGLVVREMGSGGRLQVFC